MSLKMAYKSAYSSISKQTELALCLFCPLPLRNHSAGLCLIILQLAQGLWPPRRKRTKANRYTRISTAITLCMLAG